MSAEFVFEDKNLRDFLKNLDKRVKEVKNGKKKYVGLLSAIVFKDVIDHFEKEQGPGGNWEPWSEIYKQHMQRTGKSGNKILQYNGRLRQNFKPTNSVYFSGGIAWFNDAKTSEGFPYAAAHNEGEGKLPQREFMWASDNAIDEMADQTISFIIEEGV